MSIHRYPEFQEHSSRLKSFEKWPISLVKSPNELANAGFFYTKVRDEVRCFSCGGGLKDWLSSDVAWEQHARWFGNCHFLRQAKGTVFIAGVQEKFQDKIDFEHICKICYADIIRVILLPCGHAVTCTNCSVRLYTCPLCRQEIHHRRPFQIKIF